MYDYEINNSPSNYENYDATGTNRWTFGHNGDSWCLNLYL